jgi:hypothetical protein
MGDKTGNKKDLQNGEKRGIFDMEYLSMPIEKRRNEKPLTIEQKGEAKTYAMLLGVPENIIDFDKNCTGFSRMLGINFLSIGPDVLPSRKWSKNPNSNISLKGAIAHEVIGHMEALNKGRTQKDPRLEEAQASIRAARFAPDLSKQERMVLLRDAINRLRPTKRWPEKLLLRDVKGKLHINER